MSDIINRKAGWGRLERVTKNVRRQAPKQRFIANEEQSTTDNNNTAIGKIILQGGLRIRASTPTRLEVLISSAD